MSRFISACLCAVMAFVAVAGVRLLSPQPVLAASGTVTMETPLHQSPDPSAPLLALLPEGTTVTIDGPPVDGFYPVTASGMTGWMRGETMSLEKDIVDAPVEEQPPPEGTEAVVPIAQEASEAPLAADATSVPVDPASAPVDPAVETAASDPPADALAPEPVADHTFDEPAPESPLDPVDPAIAAAEPLAPSPEATNLDPAAVEMTAPETSNELELAGTPVPVTPETAPLATEMPAPETDPIVTPLPAAEIAPEGPASVTVDMPILTGPGPDFGLIFTVPLGSTVEQTGQMIDGYISVRYKEVSGWAAFDHLAEPIPIVEETMPEETAEPVDTKTPKPGSGVAFTTVDLSLRAGPSANEEVVTKVPAGSRVVLTGVMEGEFQRVTFDDQIGWLANEYLETPEDPKPDNATRGNQQNFSERQIIRIIYQAADRYNQDRDDMLRVAQCESNLDPYAVNPSGSYGLFQFIRSTWKSTPYGGEDVFDPEANANAAGWMWKQGRKSEWVCQ